jgi:hypothetical protein
MAETEVFHLNLQTEFVLKRFLRNSIKTAQHLGRSVIDSLSLYYKMPDVELYMSKS